MRKWLIPVAIAIYLISLRAFGAVELTSAEAARLYLGGGAEGSAVEAYAAGLVHGAYVSYILELTDGGLTGAVARKMAEDRCGFLTGNAVLEAAGKRLPEVPLRVAAPVITRAICHKADVKS